MFDFDRVFINQNFFHHQPKYLLPFGDTHGYRLSDAAAIKTSHQSRYSDNNKAFVWTFALKVDKTFCMTAFFNSGEYLICATSKPPFQVQFEATTGT
jgi:hypothetical protein